VLPWFLFLHAAAETGLAGVSPSPAPRQPQPVTLVDPNRVREPAPSLSLDWALWQLLPSPGLAFGGDGPRFGLRWQVTPLLYSSALDPRLSPWRSLIVEPLVRRSGSLELFLSPDYLALDGGAAARLGGRAGLRVYFGLIQRARPDRWRG
jgi:hypothetical protein